MTTYGTLDEVEEVNEEVPSISRDFFFDCRQNTARVTGSILRLTAPHWWD